MEHPNENKLSRNSENGQNLSKNEENIDANIDPFLIENSDDNESYNPSSDEFLNEGTDISVNSPSGKSYTSNTELDFLLKEMSMPIEELLPDYSTDLTNHKRKMDSNNHLDVERKRRYINRRNYNENFVEYDDFINQITKKNVLIGPGHQVDVPDFPTFVPMLPSEHFEEILYDPYIPNIPTFSEFYRKLTKEYPFIAFEDENIWALYMKHDGNFFTALSDSEMIQKIVTFQNSSLTDWSVEECLELKNAFLKFGKRFEVIQHFCYPHKTTKSLVNTYYIWKKSPLYQQYRLLAKLQSNQKSKDEETTEETEIPASADRDSKPPSRSSIEPENRPTHMNGNDVNRQSPY